MVYTICIDGPTGDLLTAGEKGLQQWPLRIDQGRSSVSIGDPQPLPMIDGAIEAPTSAAFALACSRDGLTRVASFHDEPYLYLQDVSSGRVRRLPCDRMSAFLALSPSGQWVAAGNYQAPGFHVWRTTEQGGDEPESHQLLSSNGSAAQVVFSPDDKYLIACANDRYLWFEVGSWRLRQEIIRPTLVEGSAAFSPDGRLLALTLGPREVQLREVASGRVLANLNSGRDPVNILNLQFHPRRDDQLYLACGPYGIRLWDLEKVKETLDGLALGW
jgi:WD40 repeat protein